ncbi:hypothetical protein [Muriicola marianensis]|uniref:Uncharacterized protein n=1 Tax=Muriicola marianensis TaxID=1324801 RepID=A0ABQ1R182_9FLAO|nr:hypothetical protein [Muriicola marianensis]GGD54451.1 hypothetical protein GCM10011361_21360 [Muriicola marianensis]
MNTQNTLLYIFLFFGFGLSSSAMEKNNEINLEVDSITYIEEEDSASLDFNTEAFLPEDFNPYSAPENILHVSYIDAEQEIDLGFDTEEYLPAGFNPHRFFFDIHSIEYIEDEELFDIDLAIIIQVPTSGIMIAYDREPGKGF